MKTNERTGILTGVQVLDLTRMLSGPYCTMMLADHGAEVIKIESETGDSSRANGPFRTDDPQKEWAGYFVSLNRSKKSVQLNLKTETGKKHFRKLVEHADVVVENFRPGVMERLDLSYEDLKAINPRLVYGAIRGFGDPRLGESPYVKWPSYDVVAQAMGGIMGITGATPDSPTKIGPGVGDIFTGLMMSFGIIAALRSADFTGEGQFIDISMYDAVLSLCERTVYQHDYDGTIPGPEGNGHPLLAPFGIFPALDGHVAIGIVDDIFWSELSKCMGLNKTGEDKKYSSRAARKESSKTINKLVADWTKLKTKNELTKILGGKIPFGPVNTIKDILDDEHVNIRKMIATVPHSDPSKKDWRVAANPIKFSLNPTPEYKTPPKIGEHDKNYLQKAKVETANFEKTKSLREAFGNFATGVTIITTNDKNGSPRGFTANSFTSVSLEPPLLLVCIAKTAFSAATFQKSKLFAINILSENQRELSGLFASQEKDKFKLANWSVGPKNLPIFEESIAHFICERQRLVDAGDHIILIGKVQEHAVFDGTPLGYFKGNYFSVNHDQALIEAANTGERVDIGGVLSKDNKILLQEATHQKFIIPKAPTEDKSKNGLYGLLENLNLTPRLNFIYAIYRDTDTKNHTIFYNGTVEGAAPDGFKFFKLEDIPLNNILLPAERSMLERYKREFKHGTFGFYEGTERAGTVREISQTENNYEIKGV